MDRVKTPCSRRPWNWLSHREFHRMQETGTWNETIWSAWKAWNGMNGMNPGKNPWKKHKEACPTNSPGCALPALGLVHHMPTLPGSLRLGGIESCTARCTICCCGRKLCCRWLRGHSSFGTRQLGRHGMGADRDYIGSSIGNHKSENEHMAYIAKRGTPSKLADSGVVTRFLHHSHNTSSFAIVKESTMPRTTSWNWSMRTARRAVLMVWSISGLSKKGLVFPYGNELVCFHFGYQDVQCWVRYR